MSVTILVLELLVPVVAGADIGSCKEEAIVTGQIKSLQKYVKGPLL